MKIAFFDLDGTLTSEKDGSVPPSAKNAIRRAREAGNLMFVNTGRCFQNVEPRFREVGFDGYVNGCGTHIMIGDETKLYKTQPADRIKKLIEITRDLNIDILFECRYFVTFDPKNPLVHPDAIKQRERFLKLGYRIYMDVDDPDFTCDKFVIWFHDKNQLAEMRKFTDTNFECIDRGGIFREFVPIGFSKATGIKWVLDYNNLPLEAAYAFGDSNNDAAMLSYVKNSVVMGNSDSKEIMKKAAHIAGKASEDGLATMLEELGFF